MSIVEAKFVIRQREVRLGLRAGIGTQEAQAIRIGTASDRESQPEHPIKGRNGAEVVVVGTESMLAFGAVRQ